jgi:hypothetical protein
VTCSGWELIVKSAENELASRPSGGGIAACGWPVDALVRFWRYARAIATSSAALKAAAISAEYLAGAGAMLRMGWRVTRHV